MDAPHARQRKTDWHIASRVVPTRRALRFVEPARDVRADTSIPGFTSHNMRAPIQAASELRNWHADFNNYIITILRLPLRYPNPEDKVNLLSVPAVVYLGPKSLPLDHPTTHPRESPGNLGLII
jgi:hypothetical protein